MPHFLNPKLITGFMLWSLIFCFYPNSWAQTSIQLELKPEMKLDTYYSFRKKRFLKSTKTSALNHVGTKYPALNITKTYTSDSEDTHSLNAFITDGRTQVPPGTDQRFFPNVRNIYTKTFFAQESPDVSVVRLEVREDRPLDKEKGTRTVVTGSKRKRHTWTGIFTNPTVNGKIKIAYTFPENTWLVKIRREQAKSILNLVHLSKREENPNFKGFWGSLTGNLDSAVMEEDVLVWGKPGSTVYQEFSYNKVTEDLAGHLQFRFETVRYPETLSTRASIDVIKSSILALQSGVVNIEEKLEAQKSIISLVADRFGSEAALRDVIEKLSTLEIIDLVNQLASLRDMVFSNYQLADSKIAATILSYRLAHDYLKDLLPFCETATLELPYQNKELKASWLTISSFLLQRVAIRLEHHSLAHFRALISGIYGYQQQGLTYADVRNNPDEYKKILQSYKILSESTNLRDSPFTANATEIDYILGNVGSLGEGGTKSAQLQEAMVALAGLEKNFNRDLVNKIRMFQPNKNELVDVSDLQNRIQEMEISVGLAMDALARGSQLLSVSETGLHALTELIMNLGLNHISVYMNPMENDFEYFRTQFFDQNELITYSTSVNKCIVGEE